MNPDLYKHAHQADDLVLERTHVILQAKCMYKCTAWPDLHKHPHQVDALVLERTRVILQAKKGMKKRHE